MNFREGQLATRSIFYSCSVRHHALIYASVCILKMPSFAEQLLVLVLVFCIYTNAVMTFIKSRKFAPIVLLKIFQSTFPRLRG